MKIKEKILEFVKRILTVGTGQPKDRKEIERRIKDLEKMENDEKQKTSK